MLNHWTVHYSWLIPLLPLIGAAISGFFGARWLRGQSHWPIWLGVGGSAVISISMLVHAVTLSRHHDHEFEMVQHSGPAALMVPGESATMPAEGTGSAERASTEANDEASSLSVVKDWFTWGAAGNPTSAGTPGHPQKVEGNPAAYFEIKAGFFIDPLTITMLCVVTGIGFLITVFAAGYMKGEEGYWRFFAYLGLFIFMMTCLVMGNNLIMLYLGWEGVGLSSYLLIGYYYEKPAAREAAKKAFLVNRVGDFGFGLGIMLSFLAFGTVSYFGTNAGSGTGLLELATSKSMTAFQMQALQWIPFCLMLGAFGKSAQFPLHVWLPDAMEGPTPVSALIHAATMVTAGVYMIARCGSLFTQNVSAMHVIALVGAFTAIMAATIAMRQFDLKKVFAYSTVSQLGFMFVAVGVLAPVAGVFHLITHAFFKALLFLSSGVVMHAMAGELDMRKMSGLRHKMPITNVVILIGCLALAGCPPFSGFFSKDEIVGAALHQNIGIGVVLLLTAFLTAYYTFRLYFRVFWGPLVVPEAPADAHGHGHGHDDHHNPEPVLLMLPLVLLAIGALFAGALAYHGVLGEFLGQSPSFKAAFAAAMTTGPDAAKVVGEHFGQEGGAKPPSEIILMVVSGAISILGILVAFILHLRDRALADRIAGRAGPLLWFVDNKYWLDQIYQGVIVEPLRLLGKADVLIDNWIVDGILNLAALVPQGLGFFLKLVVQRGYLQGYAAAMLGGVGLILLVVFLPGTLVATVFIIAVVLLLICSAVLKLGH